MYNLIDWLEDFCSFQVSISNHTDRLIYIHYGDDSMKKDLFYALDYFFKGHVVKFFEWAPNYKEDNLDFLIPTWFSLKYIPPQLKYINIIKILGHSMGDLFGLNASFEYCNNIKLLIKCTVNNMNIKPIKIITNRLIYNLKFERSEEKIL